MRAVNRQPWFPRERLVETARHLVHKQIKRELWYKHLLCKQITITKNMLKIMFVFCNTNLYTNAFQIIQIWINIQNS